MFEEPRPMDTFPRIFRPQKDDPGAVAQPFQFTPDKPIVTLPPGWDVTQLPVWRPGDLVIFYGRGLASRVIELTGGPSHVGIILPIGGLPMLYESTTLCELDCELCDRKVNGVQAHTPERRIAGYDGRVFRLPLRVPLQPGEADRLTAFALSEFPPGTPYDLKGALESGPRLKYWRRFLPHPDLSAIFCSALCARLLMVANRLNWDDPKLFSPADLVRACRRTAVHGAPEPVVIPEVTCAA